MDLRELHKYYLDALDFLFRKGSEFGREYPKVASALQLGEANIGDPDVKKLIESFALFDARANYNIDQQKSKLPNFLLQFTHPDFCAPTPPSTIVQFNCERSVTVPQNSIIRFNNKHGVRCEFRTCMDTIVTNTEILDMNYAKPQFDTRLKNYEYGCLVIKLRIDERVLGRNGQFKLPLYLNSEMAPQIMSSIFGCSPETDPPVYDYDTGIKIGVVKMLRPSMSVSSVAGDPYQNLYNYSAMSNAYHFIEISFTGLTNRKNTDVTCVIQVKENKYSAHTLFLTNCVPAINLFVKRSEPVKFTHFKDNIDLVPDLLHDFKIQKILDMFIYDPSKGKEIKIPLAHGSYYHSIDEDLNRVEVFLSNEVKSKIGEHMLVFGDLLCSNGLQAELIDEGAAGYVENMNYITTTLLSTPNRFKERKKLDYWSVLSLLDTTHFHREVATGTLSLFCSKVMDLLSLSKCFRSVSYMEDLGTLNKRNAWATVVSKGVFEIQLDEPDSFILATIWADIFRKLHHLHLLVETRILDVDGTLLKVIGDEIE